MDGIKCLALDFDFTLAHFRRGLEDLLQILTKRDVPQNVAYEAWQMAERAGFTVAKCISAVKNLSPQYSSCVEDEAAIEEEFDRWIRDSLLLYPDSMRFLERWNGVLPVAIVTFGDADWQTKKIKLTNVPLGEIFATTDKAKTIGCLTERYGAPILFLDDKPEDLDAVAACLGEKVITIRINREGGVHAARICSGNHKIVTTLDEVSEIIKERICSVRRATEEDIPNVARINSNVFLGNRDNLEKAERWVSSLFGSFPLYQYFVAEVGGKMAGYIGWEIQGGYLRPDPVAKLGQLGASVSEGVMEEEAELEQLGIDPKFAGLGIATKLTKESLEGYVVPWILETNSRIASHINCIVWFYEGNRNARRVYEKCGFIEECGMRTQYSDRREICLRRKFQLVMPERDDE